MIDPIHISVVAPLPLVRAFDRFARELRDWWPRNYTWSQDVLQDIGLEPREHTAVTLVHDAFEHHGPDAPQYRAAMASSQGWPFILQRFVEAAM